MPSKSDQVIFNKNQSTETNGDSNPDNKNDNINIVYYQISIRKITLCLLIITLILNLLGVIGRGIEFLLGIEETTEIVRLVHVAEEGNLTTWFSAMLLLISSILLGVIASANHQQEKPYVKHWSAFAGIFFLMSLDEAARIHELTIEPLRSLLGTSGIFHYAWVLIAIPFLFILLVTYWKFIRDLQKRSRLLFIISGVVYVTAAMGMDMIVGYFISSGSSPRLLEPILITIEELGENLAIVLFIYTLLSHIKSQMNISEITFRMSCPLRKKSNPSN